MNTSSPENWAPVIREQVEAAGFTVSGLPEHLHRDQAMDLLTTLVGKIQSHDRPTPADPAAVDVVRELAEASDTTLEDLADLTGIHYRIEDLTAVDLVNMVVRLNALGVLRLLGKTR